MPLPGSRSLPPITAAPYGNGRQNNLTTFTNHQQSRPQHVSWCPPFPVCVIDPTLFSSLALLLLVRRTSHWPRKQPAAIHPIMSDDNQSIAAATARKRSRSPTLVEEPACTKLSRQSRSPPDGSTIQGSLSTGQHVGVALPSSATKSSKPFLIYIVNKKIPSSQLAHLKGIAKKKEFPLSTTIT